MKNLLRSTKLLPARTVNTKDLKDDLLLPLGCAFSLAFDESVSIEKYFLTVGEKVGFHNIIYGGKDGSRVVIHLSSLDKLHKFCAENRFVTIEGKQFLITKLVEPGLLLLLHNVVPHLPNFIIEEELRKTLHLKSPIFRSKYGMTDSRLSHILAYNREVYVGSEDLDNVPVFINVFWKSVVYKIHIFFETSHLRCILCGKEGHSPKDCIEAPITTRIEKLRYRSTSHPSRDYSGQPTEVRIDRPSHSRSVDPSETASIFSSHDNIQLNDISKLYPSFSNSNFNAFSKKSSSEERNTKSGGIETAQATNLDAHDQTDSKTAIASMTDDHRKMVIIDTLLHTPPPIQNISKRSSRIRTTSESTEGNAEEVKSLAESVITFKGLVEGMLSEPGTPAGYRNFLLTPEDMTIRGTRGCQTKILLTPGGTKILTPQESEDMMALSKVPRVKLDSCSEPDSKQQTSLPRTSKESLTSISKGPRVKSETFCMPDGANMPLTSDNVPNMYKGGTLTPQDVQNTFKDTKFSQMKTALNRLIEDLSALLVIMRGLEYASVNMQNRGSDILRSIETAMKNIPDEEEDEDSQTESEDEIGQTGYMTDDSLG